MKSSSDKRPNAIEMLGNGSYHYNYNVVEEEKGFSYSQVLLWDRPDYHEIAREVIRNEWSASQEFNLLNRYNSFKEGVSENEDDKNDYINYLTEVKVIKGMVKQDLIEYNESH